MDYNNYNIIPLFEGFCRKMDIDNKEIDVKVGDHKFKLKVASTPQSQAKGYMNSESGPKTGNGILFVYPGEQILRFWMKDVSFPLDIIFFNANNELVGYETMEPGASGVTKVYRSTEPALYALETEAGWASKHLNSETKYKIFI